MVAPAHIERNERAQNKRELGLMNGSVSDFPGSYLQVMLKRANSRPEQRSSPVGGRVESLHAEKLLAVAHPEAVPYLDEVAGKT